MNGVPPRERVGRLWRVNTLTYSTCGLLVLFCWLLGGDFAWSMRERTSPALMQLLFNKYSGSDVVTGLLFSSLPTGLGLILGPIVGYRSDRLRTPWGRRLPILLGTTPFIVAAMTVLAVSEPLGILLKGLLGAYSTIAVLAIGWTIFEIACIVANTVFGGLINDVVPQEVIGRFYGAFRALSLVAGIAVFGHMDAHMLSHYRAIFLGVAMLYGVGFSVMCLRVKEGGYPPPTDPSISGQGFLAAAASYLRDGFGHSYYRVYFLFAGVGGLVALPFNLYSIFYARSMGMDMGWYFHCLALTYAVSLVLAYPLGILADRLHPLRVSIAALVIYAGAMAWGAFFTHNASEFAVTLVAHGVLSGAYFTSCASLGQRLLPREKFTELSSAGGVLGSFLAMAFVPILGGMLDHARHAYRITSQAGLILAVLAVICGLQLYRRFAPLGGEQNNVAP
jgi:MFS family permease